jgi:tetratricopeptide (TPR) repeat protein
MSKKLKPLEPPDSLYLDAAEGWLGLGDVVSANESLDEISSEMRAHPAVLIMRCQIYFKAEKWDMLAEVSETLIKLLPEMPESWVNFAYAVRRKTDGSILAAKEILLEAESKFPHEYLFPFNLACYFSQLNQLEEAEKWLKKAIAIDNKTVQKLAIDDPDLLPLWDSMGGTLWKRA